MTTIGGTFWSGHQLANLPGFAETTSSHSTAQFMISIGKWIVQMGPVQPIRLFEVPTWMIPSPRVMEVKMYVILRKFVWGRGVYIKRLRMYWPFTWTANSGFMAFSMQHNARRPLTGLVEVLNKSHAVYASKTKVKRKRRPLVHGAFGKAPPHPNPETANASCSVSNPNESWDSVNSIYVYPVFQNSVYQAHNRSFSSTNTPGFGSKKGKSLPVNPYTLSLTDTNDGVVFTRTWNPTTPFSGGDYSMVQSWQRFSLQYGSLIPAAPGFPDATTYNRALSKIIEKCESEIAGNIAQDFAQYGQTTRLIAETATRLVSSYSALRRKDFKSAVKYLAKGKEHHARITRKPLSIARSAADNWLEMQYGWKPLLQDIEGSMRSLAKFVLKDESVKVVRASARRELKEAGYLTDGTSPYTYRNGFREVTTLYGVQVGVRYGVDSHLKAFLAQTGFTNPVNLAWEVLPFSFVADWFLPIGPYLSQISAWDGLVFYDGFLTQFARQNVSITVQALNKQYGVHNFVNRAGSFDRQVVKVDRAKLSAFPRGRFPELKNGMSVTHTENAVALLLSVFR